MSDSSPNQVQCCNLQHSSLSTLLSCLLQLFASPRSIYVRCVCCVWSAVPCRMQAGVTSATVLCITHLQQVASLQQRLPGLGPCKRGPLTRLACWQALSRQLV